jgi:predicted nucleic acid-binding protein
VVTDLELGHSARSPVEWEETAKMLTPYTELQMSAEIADRARDVQRMLINRGLRGRKVPDLLIAAAAEAAGAVVVHYDKDFELIASVTGQPHEWVVERGSID